MELEGERVDMPEVVERKFKGDMVKLDILRDKKPLTVTIELGSVWPYAYLAHGYDVRPRYVVYGGPVISAAHARFGRSVSAERHPAPALFRLLRHGANLPGAS